MFSWESEMQFGSYLAPVSFQEAKNFNNIQKYAFSSINIFHQLSVRQENKK